MVVWSGGTALENRAFWIVKVGANLIVWGNSSCGVRGQVASFRFQVAGTRSASGGTIKCVAQPFSSYFCEVQLHRADGSDSRASGGTKWV